MSSSSSLTGPNTASCPSPTLLRPYPRHRLKLELVLVGMSTLYRSSRLDRLLVVLLPLVVMVVVVPCHRDDSYGGQSLACDWTSNDSSSSAYDDGDDEDSNSLYTHFRYIEMNTCLLLRSVAPSLALDMS